MNSIFLIAGADFIVAVLAMVSAHTILVSLIARLQDAPTLDPRQLAVFGIVLIFTKYFARLYKHRKNKAFEMKEAFGRLLFAASASFLILLMLHSAAPELSTFPVVLAVSLVSFCFIELFLFYRFPLLYNVAGYSQNVLVFGSGPLARQIAELIQNRHNSYNFCGYVEEDGNLFAIQSEGISSTCELLHNIVQEKNIKKIVVTLKERRQHLPVRDLFSCKLRGVEIVDAVTFYEALTGKLLLEDISPSWFVFNKGFRVTRLWFVKQRIVDIVTAFVGIILFLPVLPLVVLAIKVESNGPILYRQTRVGFKENVFEIIKFRTMHANAEEHTGAVWAQKDDSRVTRIGGFLRKSRIDEVPQLINVLKGEMSFVGPRPERPEFVNNLTQKIPYYSRRHSVRPGLTGWAQVNYPYGSTEEDALEKLRYDLYFIKNFSLRLEILIIFKTIKVVLFGKGGR